MYFFFQQYFFYYHMPSSILKSLHFSCYDFNLSFFPSSFFFFISVVGPWRCGEEEKETRLPIWQRMARRSMALGAKYP